MKINWKVVAHSPGYKSLKAAYIRDVHEAGQQKRPMRKKEEYLTKFRWVISRALHYAERTGNSLEHVLNEWEQQRSYGWLNFYQENNQPKLPSGKPRNVKYMNPATYLKRDSWTRNDPAERFKRLKKDRLREARFTRERLGKKPRWPMDRKAREAEYRKHLKENL